GGGGEQEELGVGIAPEEAAETGRPRGGGRLSGGHSPSSSKPGTSDSASSGSSSPPKKKAWAHSVEEKALPPMRTEQPSQTDLRQIGQRGSANMNSWPQTAQ